MARQLVKVHFELDSNDWHASGGEFMWAAPVDHMARHFRILNSPYFTCGINYEDVVEAAPTTDQRVFEFERVVERSGHSTYMVIVQADTPAYRASWAALEEKGCSYESAEKDFSMGRRLLLSIDVPPSANIHEVYAILEKGEAQGTWIFQEGYAHLPEDEGS